MAACAGVTVDLGTGDGRYVLAAAAADPDRLVIGVDANAAAMADAARRAAGKPHRGGLPNALFVVAAAEALPPDLTGAADLVTVHFPWGSLLRGLVYAELAVMAGLVRVMRPGATLTLLMSSTDRDRGVGVRPVDEHLLRAMAEAYDRHGLTVAEARPATPADLAGAHSTWGKRLTGPSGRERLALRRPRPVWRVRATLTRPAGPETSAHRPQVRPGSGR